MNDTCIKSQSIPCRRCIEVMVCLLDLRAVCCKDQLRSCKIEKSDFLKLRQNKGPGELFLKIQVSGCKDFYFIFCNFFSILRSAAAV